MTSSQVDRIGVPTPVRVFATANTTCLLTTADSFGAVELKVPSQAVTVQLPANGGPYTIVDGENAAATYNVTVEDANGTVVGSITADGGAITFGWDGGAMVPLSMPNSGANVTATALASQSAPTGASLVGFLESGTGAVGRTLQSKIGDVCSVRDFGAKFDGVTDDTAAINAAEVALNAAGGGILYFPPGTAIVTGLTKLSGTIWQGAAIGKTVLQLKANTTVNAVVAGLNAYTLFGSGSLSGIEGWQIRDMTIDANKANGCTADGVGVYGLVFSVVNVEIKNSSGHAWRSGYGIPGVTDYGDAQMATMDRCLIHDSATGVRWEGPSDSNFANSWFYRNTTYNFHAVSNGTGCKIVNCHGWGSTGGYQPSIGAFLETAGNMLVNCTFEGSTSHQVQLLGDNNVIVGGRYYYESVLPNTVYGITLGTTGTAVSGNYIHTRIDDCQGGAIYFVDDNGLNDIDVVGYDASSGSVGYSGTPGSNSKIRIAIGGTVASNALLDLNPATGIQLGPNAGTGGTVNIGDTGNRNKLQITGYAAGAGFGIEMQPTADGATPVEFLNAAGTAVGSISTTSSATAFNTSSDYRAKAIHGPGDGSLIDRVKIYQASFHADPANIYPMTLAHELQAVAPFAVTGDKDAVDEHGKMLLQGVDYSKLVPALIAYCQALRADVAALKAKAGI